MLEINNSLVRTQCPLCLSFKIRKTGDIFYPEPVSFSNHEVRLKHIPELFYCQECKSSFISKIIREDELIDLYKKGKSHEKWKTFEFHRDKRPEMIRELSKLLSPNKYVLDIGCNAGDFLDFAKEKGCITHGIEYSVSCHDVLVGKGHQVFASESEIDVTYDVITAFDVIEHVYDINSFLDFYSTKLNKNGYLVLLTGDISCISALVCKVSWWYITLPEHIIFPSRKFFKGYEKLVLQSITSVYNSNFFYVPWFSRLKVILGNFMKHRSYTGFPPLSADHILVVMQKK
jgi:hypothetical protein